MFIALRDIRFAKGRFALIGTVVCLITLLVGFLTGLTAGLANQNISAITSLETDYIALSQPQEGEKLSYSNSSITPEIIKQVENMDGVSDVQELGISRAKFLNEGGINLNAVVFGVAPEYGNDAPQNANSVVLSSNAAKEAGVSAGDTLTLSGKEYIVEKVGAESWYSHAPVVWISYSSWTEYSERIGQTGEATALLVKSENQQAPVVDGLEITTPLKSLAALEAFKSEIGSLGMMVGMLFLISALVIGAFFTVWTIQRKSDIAIMKALGVSTKALIKDSLGQAFIILVVGISTGIAATIGLGALAGNALPFVLSPLTMGIPSVAMLLTGLAGAAFALTSVTKADPLTALSSNR